MIVSAANHQVKALMRLKKSVKERYERRVYIAEGPRIVREVKSEDIEKIYVSESFAADPEHGKCLREREHEILSDLLFARVCGTQTPQGILCLLRMRDESFRELMEHADKSLSERENELWLVLERIQDPGNLGSIFRSAEGAGVSGIIMDKHTADPYQPKVVRSAAGSIYRVPFAVVPTLPDCVGELKKRGVRICAAKPEDGIFYGDADYRDDCAFLIGNEGSGLTDELSALADESVSIPMGGELESLNAGVSAGILLFEAARQRRKGLSNRFNN